MKLEGTIEKIIIDGYERLIYKSVTNRQKELWCHLIQHEEYLEEGDHSKFLHEGQTITLKFGIDLVNDYSVIPRQLKLSEELLQPISESSYIIAVATVLEKEDDYTLICDIEGLGRNILVEFEEKVRVEIGGGLRLKGNLKAELL
ncbi:hypothetical protein [Paenibacillus jilunlii]|uniref:Uncharacterized protein n=1 Tax=Paenibacillus jilunlii TaxID=682956 RepID=A0A1G9PZQ0_9BACL|nr:hypothetical protein [Paenibacillus jilunlii]KWX73230.1 hypothetical protein AML91_19370 [Paenibacillus jilunlii]SDM04246.1 hypothetical protein SAMN05216191_10838 [Paenibacillus jilunlii]